MSNETIIKKDSFGTYYQLYKRNNTPIVFIHGVGLTHGIWEYQIYSFDNTILTYDILGHGKTPLDKDNISFDDSFKNELNSLYEFYKDGLIYDEKNKIITSETGKHFASLIGSNFDTFISGERINSRIVV